MQQTLVIIFQARYLFCLPVIRSWHVELSKPSLNYTVCSTIQIGNGFAKPRTLVWSHLFLINISLHVFLVIFIYIRFIASSHLSLFQSQITFWCIAVSQNTRCWNTNYVATNTGVPHVCHEVATPICPSKFELVAWGIGGFFAGGKTSLSEIASRINIFPLAV